MDPGESSRAWRWGSREEVPITHPYLSPRPPRRGWGAADAPPRGGALPGLHAPRSARGSRGCRAASRGAMYLRRAVSRTLALPLRAPPGPAPLRTDGECPAPAGAPRGPNPTRSSRRLGWGREGGQMEEGRGGDAAESSEASGVGSFCSAASECGPDFLGPDRDLGQATQAASSSGQRGPSRLALGGWTPVRAPRTASCSRAPGSARSPAPRAWVRGGRRPGCWVRGARGSRRSRGRPSSTGTQDAAAARQPAPRRPRRAAFDAPSLAAAGTSGAVQPFGPVVRVSSPRDVRMHGERRRIQKCPRVGVAARAGSFSSTNRQERKRPAQSLKHGRRSGGSVGEPATAPGAPGPRSRAVPVLSGVPSLFCVRDCGAAPVPPSRRLTS